MPEEPRIKPSGPAEWTDKARELFALFEGPEAREKGSNSIMLLTLAHHPSLALSFLKFSTRLLAVPKLAPRLREMIALYIGWRNKAEYEWVQHVAIGRDAGLSPEEIEAIKFGAEAPNWNDLERNVLRATEQLLGTAQVDDPTWTGLAAELDKQQLIELLLVIGNYALLSWFINAVGMEPDTDPEALEALEKNRQGRIKT